MTKLYFISLGCAKNLVDSEKILGVFEENGFEITHRLKESDLVIINTCGFIKPAIEETEKEIKRVLKTDSNKKIFVYGCGVNRSRDILTKKFPSVLGFFKIQERDKLFKEILKHNVQTNARLLTTKGYAYLKIADGCSNHCSYCTIPQIKGRFSSHPFDLLINEAIALSRLDIKELILIAQDTAQYGIDLYGRPMIVPLLKELSKIKGVEWLRLLYVHPKSITEELIYEIKTNPKVCKYLDMPIQHINDRLLRLMNRDVSKEQILCLLKELKGLTLRTTVMVGFPTESEEEFEELYDFLKKGYFDWLGVFPYYREKGTTAAEFQQVPTKIIKERFKKIIKIQQNLIKKKNQHRLNRFYKTLIHSQNHHFIGHTEFSAPQIDGQVVVKNKDLKIGKFYKLKIKKCMKGDLYAE